MSEALARLGRAAGAAALSTVSALGMHAIAGGHAPAPAAVLGPLAVAFAVAAQLSGRPLGRLRLAAVVLASQGAFHVLFGLGAGAAPQVEGGHHGSLTVIPGEAVAHSGAMPLAHVAAAAVTYLGIRRASTLTAALTRMTATLTDVLTRRLALAPRPLAPTRPGPVAAAAGPRIVPVLLSTRPLRGPPGIA